jgi:hypothetical protein
MIEVFMLVATLTIPTKCRAYRISRLQPVTR